MAPNESIKKNETQTPLKTQAEKSVAKSKGKGFMSIAEVRMVFYVLPVALVFAIFTYLNSRGHSLLISLAIPIAVGVVMFFIVLSLLKRYR